jgi:MerR family transcriptional regulator, light-induced transcriptional regulator
MNVAVVRDRYIHAIQRGERRAALCLIDEARADGLDIRTLYEEVLQPAQREIGRLWQENRITVAHEHLATAITQAAMASVYDELFRATPREGRTLIAACADTERHELGLRMVCDLMELEGWDTCYLGAAVPIESLVRIVRERRPRAVALSASIAPHLPRLQDAITAIRDDLGADAPLILAGGRLFSDDPSLGDLIGADITASTAGEAVRALEEST